MVLEQEELELLQETQKSFQSLMMRIGELEVQKQQLLQQSNAIRQQFAQHEQKLIEKYGKDAVINMQTGEVTQKEE